MIYFAVGQLKDGRDGLIVLRVLHERMEPAAKVIAAVQPDASSER
jgi:hypothetical protein